MAFTAAKNKTFFIQLCVCSLVFVLVYGCTNKYAAKADSLFHVYSYWETKLPLIPVMIVPYFSMNLLFIIALYTLPDEHSMARLSHGILMAILVAGVIFYCFPAHLGFVRNTPSYLGGLYESLFAIDEPHNLFPSLHVAISTITYLAIKQNLKKRLNYYLLTVWITLIVSSVIFTHQHHLFDIFTGILLAYFCFKICFSASLTR